ncbi:MAG TPA: MBL fold metallo-hydrolase [Nitrospiria bacterium]|nr:MBL fold metallo-hydrolase [Nitrospiria bacterium]
MQNPFGKLQYGSLKKVTDRCYLFRNVVNSGIVVTPEGVVVVDTQINAPMARRMMAAIRTVTDAPIKYVINTHYHWDHWAGNDVFREAGATLISGELTKEFMHRRSFRQRAFLRSRGFAIPEKDPALPERTFDEKLTLTLGSIPVHILYLGQAETDDAMAVHLPTERCLISGDTLMTGSFPILGQPVMSEGLSDDRAWIKTLYKMKSLSPEKIIPGHGPLGGPADIDFFIGLQTYFLDEVIPLYEQGKTTDEIIRTVEAKLPERYSNLPQVWGTPRYAILRILCSIRGWQEMKPSAIPKVDPELLKIPLKELEDHPQSYIRAAEFFEMENKLDLAIGIMNEGCERHSKDPGIWVARGRLLLKCSRAAGSVLERADFFQEVCRSAEKALSIDPRHAPALVLYGSYHAMGAFRNGDDPTEAMMLLERALALPMEPAEEAKARFFLGICYRAMEREDLAVACFNKALELDPSYAPPRMAMMSDEEMLRVPERFKTGGPRLF